MRALPYMHLLRQPLLRLLAINLGIGVAMAALMLGGLLALNPHHLRDLIFADQAGGAAFGLLLFGFVVTFGSTAMGSAVMMLNPRSAEDHDGTGERRLAPARAQRPIPPVIPGREP
ncbi:MAG TPA: hypothetical protein VIV34_11770 [Pseudolabrys sp.]